MSGRKWHKIDSDGSEQIKNHLLNMGGEEKRVSSEYELWRIKFSDSTFTFYSNGTLYSTPSNQIDPAVEDAWLFIDKIAGSVFVKPTREFLIGLDETGKGELIGHMHLVGVLIPGQFYTAIEPLVSTADTKKSHTLQYWDAVFNDVCSFIGSGLSYIEERIPPWHTDKYNLNKIMDVVYQRILATFFRRHDVSACRIVIDDYGIGPTLKRFTNFLEKQGAETIVAQKSDERYLEARVAALIAKRGRVSVIHAINKNPGFNVGGMAIGSGNASDKSTVEWLKRWKLSGQPWPWFVKKSFSTIRDLEGAGKARKSIPPIREDLLSEEFRNNIDEGRLNIAALSVVCPECGVVSKAVLLTGGKDGFSPRCPNCRKIIRDLGFTLRYYCAFVVPDSNVINRGLLSKDLNMSKFFEDFCILMPSVVRFECDTPGGKKELERIGRYVSMGRVKMREVGTFEPARFKTLSSQERDDLVMQACVDECALLLSADNQVKGLAVSRDIFTIYVP